MASAPQSNSEQEQLHAALEHGAQRWLDTLASVPESHAADKLNADSWTILQVAEHVAAAEHGMSRALELAAAKTTPCDYEKDQRIVAGGTDRATKRQAPPPSLPKGRWTTLAECAEAFRKSRARTLELIAACPDLRGKMVTHPLMGELDGHQLILVMAGHSARHALQVEEIRRGIGE